MYDLFQTSPSLLVSTWDLILSEAKWQIKPIRHDIFGIIMANFFNIIIKQNIISICCEARQTNNFPDFPFYFNTHCYKENVIPWKISTMRSHTGIFKQISISLLQWSSALSLYQNFKKLTSSAYHSGKADGKGFANPNGIYLWLSKLNYFESYTMYATYLIVLSRY